MVVSCHCQVYEITRYSESLYLYNEAHLKCTPDHAQHDPMPARCHNVERETEGPGKAHLQCDRLGALIWSVNPMAANARAANL